MSPPKLQKMRRAAPGRPREFQWLTASSKLVNVFFGPRRRAVPPPWWSAAPPLAEEPVVRQPREAAPLAEEPAARQPREAVLLAGEPVARQPREAALLAGEPVVRQPREAAPLAEEPVVRQPREAAPLAEEPVARQPREAAQVVELPQTDGSPVVVPRQPVGGSPGAALHWQAIDSRVAEQPDRVAQRPDSAREHGQRAFVGHSMADCAHDRRRVAAAPWELARPVAIAAPMASLVRAEQGLARRRPAVPPAAALRQADRLRLAPAAEVVPQRVSA
jgi:hypothetical protein